MKSFFLIVSCLLLPIFVCWGQDRIEVFTWHPDDNSVILYDDVALTNMRIKIYPNYNENMAGCIVYIDGEVDQSLRILINPLGYYFVQKGTLAVNTRNYNNDFFFLYENPDIKSQPIFQSTKQQTMIIYGVQNGWLLVKAENDANQTVIGWLPPDMQCGNPYTTCN